MASKTSSKRAATKTAKPAKSAKKQKRRGAATAKAGPCTIPKLLYAQVSPHSIGGVSLFDVQAPVVPQMVPNFMSETDLLARTANALHDAGFTVLQISPYTINVAAPIATFEKAFGTHIEARELDTIKGGGVRDTATFFTCAKAPRFGLISARGTAFESLVEGVAIETPRYFFATNPLPPVRPYWHLDVPQGVSLGCNADAAHRGGTTGSGVKVAMVDSGHFAHPFFAARGYRVQPVTLGPGAANAAADENGHGTAESANIFAVAPDAELWPVKINFANATGAFNAAVALNPHIITCSWGSDVRGAPLSAADQVLALAIADAVARGIVVVFSAGNGHFGFPGQHPDVISAGGVFLDADASLQASDYASGFASPIYPGRNAPDLCGLVGMRPRAAYIMLPLQPGCQIDQGLAGGSHPDADETAADDGWAAISGTSAAAPQLAGAAALIRQAGPTLDPAAVRDVLVRTAIDVTRGNCNPASSGAAAGAGVDLATGAGLVDANAAVLVAKVRSLGTPLPQTAAAAAPARPTAAGTASTLQLVFPPLTAAPQPAALVPTASPAAATMLSTQDLHALEDLVIRRKLNPLR